MKIYFISLCAMLWLGTISNTFTVGIRPMHNQPLIINSLQSTPSPNVSPKTRAKHIHGIESVISMLIEMQEMREMLNPSLQKQPF